MVRKPLPQPVSTTDRYLHDIATSLRQLCGDTVTELQEPDAFGEVKLQEPAPVAPPKAGRGSSVDAWRAYATRLGVNVPYDAGRDDIIALVEQAA